MTDKKVGELLRVDYKHIMHPLLPIGSEVGGPVFVRGRGIFLQDTEGREYIDISSQLVNANLGHGRREIVDAVIKQAKELQYATLFYEATHPAIIEYAQKLAEIMPAGLHHFFFVAGGSEANEFALQTARAYWRQQGKNKFKIVSLHHSYHGKSFATATAGGILGGALTADIDPVVPGFVRIPSYYCYRCDFGAEYPSCGIQCAKYLERTIEVEGADSVAAFFAEPVQGAGGVIPPPSEYWPMVRKICTEHNLLLICDEVMSGFCRTGKMFAIENWGVVPDIMTMSKGINSAYLPFGCVAVSGTVFEGLEGRSVGGFSSSGNPICAAAASAAIDVYLKEKIAEHVIEIGKYAKKRLEAEFGSLPYVGDIRGLGLFIGIELVSDKATKAVPPNADIAQRKIKKQLLENGVLERLPSSDIFVIYFTPPLIITKEEVDKAFDIMYSVISNFKPD